MASDGNFWTATMKGDIKTVKEHINAGKDVNAQDNGGYTGLMWAAMMGKQGTVELLIRHKANLDIQNRLWGETGLMYAASRGHPGTVELLIRHKANLDIQNESGWTGLMSAASRGQQGTVELLIRHKANLDIQNKEGHTVLMNAVMMGEKGTVELLIRHKANLDIQNKSNMTLHDIANARGHHKIAELIDQVKAQIIEEKKSNLCRREYGRAFALASRITHSPNSENITMSNAQKRLPPGYRELIEFFSRYPGLVKWTGIPLLLYFKVVGGSNVDLSNDTSH